MFSAQGFRELVSGRQRGVTATILRSLLELAEAPYSTAVHIRNLRYDRGHAEIHQVDVPVISVGNLTLGGTGKTPMVQYLAEWFRAHNIRIAIVSRGYRAAAGQSNDEARELEEKMPDVPHIQNPNRVVAAQTAIDNFDTQLILLDDGFQHRRLSRDLDIVLIDALEPFGFEHVFPRGMLRESIRGLERADVVALSRSDLIEATARNGVRKRVEEINPNASFIEVAHSPSYLRGHSTSDPLGSLSNKRVAAFCGIGNPAGFRRTLEGCQADIVGFHEFPDHHDYSHHDRERLAEWARSVDAELIVCTHKDLVKVSQNQLGLLDLRALVVELKVTAGQQELVSHLKKVLDMTWSKNSSSEEA